MTCHQSVTSSSSAQVGTAAGFDFKARPSPDAHGDRIAPLVFGAAAALITWWVWGSLHQLPAVQDEAAYLFQARTFASGLWAAPSPPLPEFFEQAHVLVTPTFAAKYPPGQALLLLAGVLIGFPGLVPVLLNGLTGGLLYVLARRLATPWIAFLTWVLWVTAPASVIFRASYLSEVTTCAVWLAAWYATLRWREAGHGGWLLAVTACVGLGALTRPFTTLALALPLAVVVLRTAVTRRAWSQLTPAIALGVGILAIVPLWNARITGDWRVTPLSFYARSYLPFDVPGFGADSTPPLRPLPADLAAIDSVFRPVHEAHTIAALPATALRRIDAIGTDMWYSWRILLLPFFLIGWIGISTPVRVGLASSGLLLLIYLIYAHPPEWTLYYLELTPVLAFLTARGVGVSAGHLRSWWGPQRLTSRMSLGYAFALTTLLGLLIVLPAAGSVRDRRERTAKTWSYKREFLERISKLPKGRAIVFVRYGPLHNIHASLITNEPDLQQARVWVVHDRGIENVRLMTLAPDRRPYLYDQAKDSIMPLPSP